MLVSLMLSGLEAACLRLDEADDENCAATLLLDRKDEDDLVGLAP